MIIKMNFWCKIFGHKLKGRAIRPEEIKKLLGGNEQLISIIYECQRKKCEAIR